MVLKVDALGKAHRDSLLLGGGGSCVLGEALLESVGGEGECVCVCVQVWQEGQFSYPILEEETEIPLNLQKGLSPRAGEWVSGVSVLEVPSQLVPGALSPGT